MLQGGGSSYFKWHWHPGYLKYLRFFLKNLLCLLFFLVQVILLVVLSVSVLPWFLISALSFRNFSTSCNTLWNSMDEMSPSCIACEMISAILSNLLWASSFIVSCFLCFMVKVLEDFHVMTIARERSKLVPLKARPKGRPTPLANAAIQITSVIIVDMIKFVSMIPVIVLNRFIFFGNAFTNFNFVKQICLNSS